MPKSEVAPHPEAQRQMLLDPVPLLHQTRLILQVVECWKTRSMQWDGPGFVSPPPAIDDTGPTWWGVRPKSQRADRCRRDCMRMRVRLRLRDRHPVVGDAVAEVHTSWS